MEGLLILHWIGYLYSRFSKNLEAQRNVIKMIAKMASKDNSSHMTIKKKDNDIGSNQGYA